MASTIILSDNGASSGSAGLKTTGGNDGVLILQTTTSGGTATNAVYVDTSQNVGIGTSTAPGTNGGGVAIYRSDYPRLTLRNSTTGDTTADGVSHYLNGVNYTIENVEAGYVRVLTNGSEAMRIDSSGRLGIVATPSSWSVGSVIEGAYGGFSLGTSLGNTMSGNAYYNSGWVYKASSTATLYLQDSTGHTWQSAPSGTAGNAISFNNGIKLDTAGNFMVGATTAGGQGSYRGLTIAGGSVGSLGAGFDYAGAVYKYDAVNENGWIWWNTRSIGGLVQEFFVTSSFTKVGNINCSTTATNYVTSSDYRLKENIQPMTGALAKVAQLKPCTYTWKVDGSEGQGFIAHELGEVVPQCVSGEKDAVNEDGSIDPQGIDTSFLVATLTAAIQEQQALINNLTERLAALEAK